MNGQPTPRAHGGADAQGPARWDFSTCANAAGPCPSTLAAVQAADPTRYPDPGMVAVRQALAELHGVAPWRILPAASASEFIQRLTAVTGQLWPGAVGVPRHAYGDYASAAAAWGRPVRVDGACAGAAVALRWYADPSSPLGDSTSPPHDAGAVPTVLDAVYAPLRLCGQTRWRAQDSDAVFVLHSPNKALGLTGIRGAYVVAPRTAAYDVAALCHALEAVAPSWPLSAQADAMLRDWATPPAQAWVQRSHATLVLWKAALQVSLAARGFRLRPSVTPHFVVQVPGPLATASAARLRRHGVAVRDAASFGLPGHWRVSAQPPQAQDALLHALDTLTAQRPGT